VCVCELAQRGVQHSVCVCVCVVVVVVVVVGVVVVVVVVGEQGGGRSEEGGAAQRGI